MSAAAPSPSVPSQGLRRYRGRRSWPSAVATRGRPPSERIHRRLVIAIAFPALWALGVDLALPFGVAAAVALSPFAVAIAMKEENLTPGQWWRQASPRGRDMLAAQRGLKGRLTVLAEVPMVVL